MKSLFNRSRNLARRLGNTRLRQSVSSGQRRNRGSVGFQEQLETRRALAVTHYVVDGPSYLLGNGDGDAPSLVENGLLDERRWITIVSDEGDDIYIQQTPPTTPGQDAYVPSLLYAASASFLDLPGVDDFGEIEDVNSFTDVFVTNASYTSNRAELDGEAQDSDGYPFNNEGSPELNYADRSYETTFVLSTGDVDNYEPIEGIISNGVGGRWRFANDPGIDGYRFDASDFLPEGVPTGPNPRSARVILKNERIDIINEGETDAIFVVTWDSNSLDPGGMDRLLPPVLEEITYDWWDDNNGAAYFDITLFDVVASSPADPSYRLPVPDAVADDQAVYELAPGSLRGFIDIESQFLGENAARDPYARFEFTTITQFAIDDPLNLGNDENIVVDENLEPVLNAAGQPLRRSTLVFRQIVEPTQVLPWKEVGLFYSDSRQGDDEDGIDLRWMTGTLTYVQDVNAAGDLIYRPTVELQFRAVEAPNNYSIFRPDFNPFQIQGDLLGPQEVGRVSVDATYAVFNQPTQFVGGNFTLYDGQDFSRNLTVDLLAPGATISIESPVLFNAPGGVDEDGDAIVSEPYDSPDGHFIDLRASNTQLEAQMWSGTSFNLRDSFHGEAKAEQLFVNAANAARTYDIRVKDDPLTDSVRRSKVFVSTTGSLAGLLPTAPGILPENAESLFVLSNTGDVFVEGTIAADYQSYILQSPAEFDPDDPTDIYGNANRAPYYLSTQSQISGADTGLLRGIALAVTLGNDTPTFYDDAVNGGSSAFNVVTLETEVDSVRIQASDRSNNALQTPFPYDLWLYERDKLRVDGVAASSLPLVIKAQDDLTWNASLLSASDVTSESYEGDLDLNAPLASMFGTISLAAERLSVRNSVRVLDTYNDESSLYNTDVILTARNGDLLLTGPISGVNTIELIQAGEGSISGPSRVVSERVLVRAEGPVIIKTETAEITGSAASLTVDESDDVFVNEFTTTDKFISVVANGFDPAVSLRDEFGDLTGETDRVPALRAVLPDAERLVVSAPRGSIDVRVTNASPLTLGDASAIVARTARSMAAGGSVFIESLGGNVDVLDGPYAGSGATRVRLASTDDLGGTYLNRTPGTFPATLTATTLGSLVLDGKTARVRDFVLIKNQGNGAQNGIYQVVNPGSPASRWVLRRAALFDQTSEVPEFLRVTPTEGTQAGRVYVISSYENEYGTTPRSVSTVLNNYDAIPVQAVSTSELQAEYTFNTALDAWQLTSSFDELIPLFDGVEIELNDTVLVRLGSRNVAGEFTRASNGVYTVSSVGSDLSPWVLTEVKDVVTGDPIETGIFKAIEGTLRARRTGNAFKLAYDSLGSAEMVVDDESASVTLEIGSRDLNDRVQFITSTNLGQNDAVGSLGKMITLFNQNSYVNIPEDDDPDDDTLDPRWTRFPQFQTFNFTNGLGGVIQLSQELPRLTRPVVIDATLPRVQVGGGLSQVVVDGSFVRLNRDWSVVEGGEAVDGLEVVSSKSPEFVFATTRAAIVSGNTVSIAIDPSDADDRSLLETIYVGRQVSSSAIEVSDGEVAATIEAVEAVENADGAIVGVTLTLSGGTLSGDPGSEIEISIARFADAGGSTIRGLMLGGFSKGASVKLNGADDVLVDDLRLGVTLTLPAGQTQYRQVRLGNKIGIDVGSWDVVTGAPTADGSSSAGFSTVANSYVYASSQVGIRLNGSKVSQDGNQLRVVGTTVGGVGLENTTGVDISDGRMLLGALPANVSVRRVIGEVLSNNQFRIAANLQAVGLLYEGLGVASTSIAPEANAIAAEIDSISDPVGGFVTITIRNGSITTPPSPFDLVSFGFGSYTLLAADSTDIPIPVGVQPEEIFLGQSITGTGITAGTKIVGVAEGADGRLVLQMSRPATISTAPGAASAVVLGAASRNTIANNARGVTIRGGSTSIINSDISNSVFDGVLVGQAGTSSTSVVTIGGAAGRVGRGDRVTDKDLVFSGNAIFGNGSAGIRVSSTVNPANVVIRGNRLGVTMSGALNINRAGNIVAPAAFYGPVWGTYGVEQSALTIVSSADLNRTSRTVRLTAAAAHGLSQGDPVRLNLTPRLGATVETAKVVDAVFLVGRVDSPTQFTVSLSADEWNRLGMERYFSPGNFADFSVAASRVQFKVFIYDNGQDHNLNTGHRLWLEFGARNGEANSVQAARKITRISGEGNAFLVDGVTGADPVRNWVYINRYGRQSGGSPVAYAFQLSQTQQLDYEGNLHGVAAGTVQSPGGGVISNPVIRPPVRR